MFCYLDSFMRRVDLLWQTSFEGCRMKDLKAVFSIGHEPAKVAAEGGAHRSK